MTNGDLGDQLCSELLGGIAHEYDWPLAAGERVGTFAGQWVPAAVDPAVSASYAGEYELRTDFRLRVAVEGETFVLHSSGQPPLPLVLASGEVLRPRAIGLEVSFHTGDGGEATGLTLWQGWTTAEAPRLF